MHEFFGMAFWTRILNIVDTPGELNQLEYNIQTPIEFFVIPDKRSSDMAALNSIK